MKNYVLHIGVSLLFTYAAVAQTTNQGMLYVSEGTAFSTVQSFNNEETGAFYNDGQAFIYSHFNNNGIVDFHQNTGIMRFIGSTDQNISGSNESYFYNSYFNNTSSMAPFKVSGHIHITGNADFYNGILDNDNFGGDITFNTNALHSNTSDYSHVDGAVFKIGDTEFTFPIGDGGYYRFASISAPAASTAIFESKFYFENSNTLYAHELKDGAIEAIDNQEYWIINKESSRAEDMLITLSWRDVTTPQDMIAAASNNTLTIVRWDEQANMWVNEGGAIDIDNNTVTTAVNGYGVFTFGRLKADLSLPCNVIVYNAVTSNKDGQNDYLRIDSAMDNCARDFKVQIYNRWGVKVFESDNYGINGDLFDGFSRGRLTVNDFKQLPTGTYYYILDYQYGNPIENNRHKKAGFLYLSGN